MSFASSIFSSVFSLIVNCSLYPSGASGDTAGRRGGGGGGGAEDGNVAAGFAVEAGGRGACGPLGSLRIESAASGLGARPATIFSTSCVLLPRAASRTVLWFSAVRCGARSLTVVRLIDPSARRSSVTGNLWAVQAAAMRL